MVFNYLASMRFVFSGKDGMKKRHEFMVFVILSVIGLGLNDLIMCIGTGCLGAHYMLTKVGATIMIMVWNFVTRKLFLDSSESLLARQ